MGVSAGDFDRDGDQDIFLTHMATETNTLYVNDGHGNFRDDTLVAGLATTSLKFTGFGASWIDYDNDGWLDLFTVNGDVKVVEELERAGDPYPLHQTDQIFRNLGDGSFEEVTARAGTALDASAVSRGAIFGDVDNDGDTDAVVINNNGPARLLINRVGQSSPWLGIRLSREGGTHGTRVEVLGSAPPLVRWAGTHGSYACANDPRILMGLKNAPDVTEVRVVWPDGTPERFTIKSSNAYITLTAGNGRRSE